MEDSTTTNQPLSEPTVPLHITDSNASTYTPGETIWTTSPHEGQYITTGQVFYHYSTSQESVTEYLWETDGSEWTMYDAWTGRWILNITGVPTGTKYFGPHGEILQYTINTQNNTLTMWNSTKVLLTRIRAIGVAIDWTPVQGVYNYSDGHPMGRINT